MWVNDGDAALKKYSEKFDGYVRGCVPRKQGRNRSGLTSEVPAQDIEDMKAALHNLRAFCGSPAGHHQGTAGF